MCVRPDLLRAFAGIQVNHVHGQQFLPAEAGQAHVGVVHLEEAALHVQHPEAVPGGHGDGAVQRLALRHPLLHGAKGAGQFAHFVAAGFRNAGVVASARNLVGGFLQPFKRGEAAPDAPEQQDRDQGSAEHDYGDDGIARAGQNRLDDGFRQGINQGQISIGAARIEMHPLGDGKDAAQGGVDALELRCRPFRPGRVEPQSGQVVLPAVALAEIETETAAAVRVRQVIPRLVGHVGRQPVRRGGLDLPEELPGVQIDDHHAEALAVRPENRRGGPDRRPVGHLDHVPLPVEIEFRQPDLIGLELQSRLEIVPVLFGLKPVGLHCHRPTILQLHPHQFEAVVGHSDVADLVIRRMRHDVGGEDFLEAFFPGCVGVSLNGVDPLVERGTEHALDGGNPGQEGDVPSQFRQVVTDDGAVQMDGIRHLAGVSVDQDLPLMPGQQVNQPRCGGNQQHHQGQFRARTQADGAVHCFPESLV